MFHWEKIGHIFNPQENVRQDWMHEFAQAPCTLIFEKFVRVYFSTRSKRDINNQFVSYSAFIDLDRNDLRKIINIADKPIIKLGERGSFDEFGTYPVSVIRNKDSILAYYAGWTRCESVPFNTAIGIAKSNDGGKTFEKLGRGPVLSYSLDEPFLISGPKIRNFNDQYYLFYISGKEWKFFDGSPEMILKIRCATSRDGINWKKYNKDLILEENHNDESQASPDVLYSNGKYHMFFCNWIPSTFRITKSRKIGYAYSYDLVNWVRDDDKVGITVSQDGFDSKMLAYPHVFELDGCKYMLYLGNDVGKRGFGLAKLTGELT